MWEMIKPIVISVITAFVTVQLSLRRFRTEKLWERKEERYSQIVDALHHLKNYCKKKLDAECGAPYGEHKLSKEEDIQLSQQYKAALNEVNRAIDVGSFVMGSETIKILEIYLNRPQLDYHENSFIEIIEQELKYAEECLRDFKRVAQKDLGFK